MTQHPRTAFLFPGQGSQHVGMVHSLSEAEPAARAVFQEADEALGFSLSKLCFEGPQDDLQLTANTQPAILTASIAVYRVLERRGQVPDVVAGHSLGEYSALVAAGSLELADAVRLVRRRGELMQEAVAVGEGAMAAILGLSSEQVREITGHAAAGGLGVCEVANYNSPEQTVIAGTAAAVERARELASEAGAKRALELPVSAPFHCALMRPAREGLEPSLRETPIRAPRIEVICNVDARPVSTADEVRDALIRQVDGAVRWVESVERIAESGVGRWAEVGPGKVLSGLVRRIVSGVRPQSIADAEGIASWEAGP